MQCFKSFYGGIDHAKRKDRAANYGIIRAVRVFQPDDKPKNRKDRQPTYRVLQGHAPVRPRAYDKSIILNLPCGETP